MEVITNFLHKARLWAELHGMGNEEAALAQAIRGLNHLGHMPADEINRWNPATGEMAEPKDPEEGVGITLFHHGAVPGDAKDVLYNPVKLSSHSPSFPDPGMLPKLDEQMLKDAKDAGIGFDPEKANPDEVEASVARPKLPQVEPGKGVTTTEQELFGTPGEPGIAPHIAHLPPSGTDVGGYASGTQGTVPGPRSPFAQGYQSRSLAAADGVKLPIPAEVQTDSALEAEREEHHK